MPAFPKEWAEFAINETVGIFKEASDLLIQGEAEYIRAGEPRGVQATLNLDAARMTCRRYARETDSINAGTQSRLARVCRPYLEDIGEWPGEPSFQPPAFQGGQCECVEYIFTLRGQGGNQPLDTVPLLGPVTGFRLNPGTTSVQAFCRGAGFGGDCASPAWRSAGVGGSAFEDGIDVLAVERVDGGPDECGSGPPEYQPPPPITTPLPPTTVPTPGIDIDIDVDIDPDGGIQIIFDVDGDITFSPRVSPEDDPEFSDPLGPKFPGDRGAPGAPVGIENGESAAGEAPEGSVLVGVEVKVVSASAPANVQDLPSYTVYRAACYVYLGTGGSLDQQPEAATVISPQFFYAPKGSTRWAVYSGWGYNLLVTPYYRSVSE